MSETLLKMRRILLSLGRGLPRPTARDAGRGAMALAALSGDEQRVIFSRLCNPLDPGVAVAFASASNELRELSARYTQHTDEDPHVQKCI